MLVRERPGRAGEDDRCHEEHRAEEAQVDLSTVAATDTRRCKRNDAITTPLTEGAREEPDRREVPALAGRSSSGDALRSQTPAPAFGTGDHNLTARQKRARCGSAAAPGDS